MNKPFSRQKEVSRIHYSQATPGRRAIFLVEARTRKEVRQITRLFDTVGQLAEVVPISHGTLMSYAVQVHSGATLFGKIEWLLKTQFAFSLVERSFSEVTFRLVQSLCEESETEMAELPQCGICEAVDPFPARATVQFKGQEEPAHLSYCARCASLYAEEQEDEWIRGLVSRDRARLRVSHDVVVTLLPDMVEERPEQEIDLPIAI